MIHSTVSRTYYNICKRIIVWRILLFFNGNGTCLNEESYGTIVSYEWVICIPTVTVDSLICHSCSIVSMKNRVGIVTLDKIHILECLLLGRNFLKTSLLTFSCFRFSRSIAYLGFSKIKEGQRYVLMKFKAYCKLFLIFKSIIYRICEPYAFFLLLT